MHAGRAVGVRAGALAAADRLVVGEAVVAEDDVVHRPLTLRGHGHRLPERGEDDVDDPARRLVLPAATAAGGRALTRQPSGARTVTGAKAPPDAGRSGAVRQRTTKKQAERVTASGQLRLPVVLRRRAGEVDVDRVARRS